MRVEDWGTIEYETSVARQLALVDDVAAGGEERLILCNHPPVVTLGRATTADDLLGWQGQTVESSRGGRATYHGPNQLVIYPIFDLRRERESAMLGGVPVFAPRDVHSYLRWLEASVVRVLGQVGIRGAEARTTQQGETSLTGVWVGESKPRAHSP